ncbi:MAG: class I SAM-dependent methyltransferase [Acidobacteria bacterium]|nr:class I SAM-dependent methyltransferase [Acidobacteriota bacterium]
MVAQAGPAGYPTTLSQSPYQFKSSRYSSHARVLELLPPVTNGARVLDVGCGPGYLCELLTERGYRVTGLERAGWGPPDGALGYTLIDADLDQRLPPLNERFDAIVCADILEHLRDPAALLQQLCCALAPGGRLIASLPNSGHLYFRLVILSGRFPKHDRGLFDRTHIHFLTWDGWRELLTGAGFTIRTAIPTSAPVGLALETQASAAAIRAAEWLSYGLANLRRQLFAYQFVVEAFRTAKE